VPDQTKLISAFQHHRHSAGFSSTVKVSLILEVNKKILTEIWSLRGAQSEGSRELGAEEDIWA